MKEVIILPRNIFIHFLIKEGNVSRGLETSVEDVDRGRWDFSQYDSFIDKIFALLFYYVSLAPDTWESWGFYKLSSITKLNYSVILSILKIVFQRQVEDFLFQ